MNNAKFNELDEYFQENKFEELENDEHGKRFLKLRTISRKAELKEFCDLHEIDYANITENLFCYLFKKQTVTIVQVNEFIKKISFSASIKIDFGDKILNFFANILLKFLS